MGYRHIPNLYRQDAQAILLFRECYALEKIHGTSAHVSWRDGGVRFHAGGEKHDRFAAIFDSAALTAAFAAMGHAEVTIYGEAYGGKQQAQAWRYGPTLRFAAFEVQGGEAWLSVPDAAALVASLGLEFVHYARVSTDLAALDAERDAPSEQARRNGITGDQPREGVVLRPLVEMTLSSGARILAKHKRAEESETRTPRAVDPGAQQVLTDAGAIAIEWATPRRLEHVIGHLTAAAGGVEPDMTRTRDVIAAMVEDVLREGAGEVVDSKAARQAIGTVTAKLFHAHLHAAAVQRQVSP